MDKIILTGIYNEFLTDDELTDNKYLNDIQDNIEEQQALDMEVLDE